MIYNKSVYVRKVSDNNQKNFSQIHYWENTNSIYGKMTGQLIRYINAKDARDENHIIHSMKSQ